MNNTRRISLGLFFVVSLSILAGYTLFLTDTASLFAEPIQLRVYFPEAIGLREGDPVQAVGVRVGRVKELKIDIKAPVKERVLATLNLTQELELTEGAVVAIQESTLLGGRHVFIDPGEPGGVPLALGEGEAIYGYVQKNPIDALSEVGDVFAENRVALNEIVNNIDSLISGVREGKGPLGRLMVDEELAANLAATIENIANATARIEAGEGLLGALISDPELADEVRSILGRVDAIAADLQEGRGIAGRLIYDEELANELQSVIESAGNVARRIEEGEGLVGRLVSDDALADEFNGIVDSLSEVSNDLAALTTQVRSGEGTVGKLLMDEELYDEALVAVKLLTRSLEDYREAAPISAFTGVLFSGF